MLDPSHSLNKSYRLLKFLGVINKDRVFNGFRMMILICTLSIPLSICYSWSFLRYYRNQNDLLNVIYVVGTIQVAIKMIELKHNQAPLKRLVLNLDPEHFDILPGKHQALIKDSLRITNKAYIFFPIFPVLSILFIVLSWIMQIRLDGSEKRILIFDTWMPYSYQESPIYELTILFQIISSVFLTKCIVGCDTFIFGLLHLMITQIDILNEELASLGSQTNYCYPLLEDIKICVIYNKRIKNNIRSFNFLFHMGLLTQLILTQLLVCISLLMAQKNKWSSFHRVKDLILIFSVILQLYFYCYFGQKIITKSNNFSNSLYFSKWYECCCKCPGLTHAQRKTHERHVRKNFLIIMCCVQKPIQLTAGKLFVLRYETFLQILKAGYSYFTVFGS